MPKRLKSYRAKPTVLGRLLQCHRDLERHVVIAPWSSLRLVLVRDADGHVVRERPRRDGPRAVGILGYLDRVTVGILVGEGEARGPGYSPASGS